MTDGQFQDHAGERGRDARHDQPGVAPDELQRLWAPWRFGYIEDGTRIDGCPFCVLPGRPPSRDRESLIVHRGERTFVVFNAYPYNPGHLMVCPYEHVADLEDLDDATADELWQLARSAVPHLKRSLRCQGVNIGLNLGAAAGAGIAEHLHLHLVPRWIGDTNFISVVGATRVLPRALEEMYDELAAGWPTDHGSD